MVETASWLSDPSAHTWRAPMKAPISPAVATSPVAATVTGRLSPGPGRLLGRVRAYQRAAQVARISRPATVLAYCAHE